MHTKKHVSQLWIVESTLNERNRSQRSWYKKYVLFSKIIIIISIVRKILCDRGEMIRQEQKGTREPASESWHHLMRKKQLVQRAKARREASSSKKLREVLCGLNMVTKGAPGKFPVLACSKGQWSLWCSEVQGSTQNRDWQMIQKVTTLVWLGKDLGLE